MLRNLFIHGFKSFSEPTKIDFCEITLLYGENSSGKSSVLQALQYAREVFCNNNLDCLKTEIGGDFANLRGFRQFVSNRSSGKNGLVLSLCVDDMYTMEAAGDGHRYLFAFDSDSVVSSFRFEDNVSQSLSELEAAGSMYDQVDGEYPKLLPVRIRNGQGNCHFEILVSISDNARLEQSNSDVLITGLVVLVNKQTILRFLPVEVPDNRPDHAGETRYVWQCQFDLSHDILPESIREAATAYEEGKWDFGTEAARALLDNLLGKETVPESPPPPESPSADACPPPDQSARGVENGTHCEESLQNQPTGEPTSNCEAIDENASVNERDGNWKDRLMARFGSQMATGRSLGWFDWSLASKFQDCEDIGEIEFKIEFNLDESEDLTDDERKQIEADLAIAEYYAKSLYLHAAWLIRRELQNMRYIGPLRSHYTPQSKQLKRDAERSWADGLGAWDYLVNHPDITGKVNEWMTGQERFNFDCRIQSSDTIHDEIESYLQELDEPVAAAIRDRIRALAGPQRAILTSAAGLVMESTDIGVGYSQVLPIVVAAMASAGHYDSDIVLLEQPELHIHVRLQAVLADLLAFGTQERRSRHQFIVETHSETLLLRLMRRIRETTKELLPEDRGARILADHVRIHYIQRKDGSSTVKPLELDTLGNLVEEWPDELFDISFKERFGE